LGCSCNFLASIFPQRCLKKKTSWLNQTDESESRRDHGDVRSILGTYDVMEALKLTGTPQIPLFYCICVHIIRWMGLCIQFLRAPYTALSSEQCSHCLTTDMSSRTSETDINISVDEVHFLHLLDTDISFLGSSWNSLGSLLFSSRGGHCVKSKIICEWNVTRIPGFYTHFQDILSGFYGFRNMVRISKSQRHYR